LPHGRARVLASETPSAIGLTSEWHYAHRPTPSVDAVHRADSAKAAAEKLGAGEKRIVADVPEHIHRQMRVKSLERGVPVRDYILELLAKDGIR
jgi:hypothetical protein